MISGKAFADRCKWVLDPRYPERAHFNPELAQSGDWVFVNGDYLRYAQQSFGKTFTFIVHNTDRPFGPRELAHLLPMAKHIYAINTTVQHRKLTTIPIGFVDKQLPFLQSFQHRNAPRDIDIYENFTLKTNLEKRTECHRAFEGDSRVVRGENKTVPEYYADLCRSKFVLCPEGTGIDTHRVYESLLCGATPVVLRNSLSHLYERLPVCILDKWTDPMYMPRGKSFSMEVTRYLE